MHALTRLFAAGLCAAVVPAVLAQGRPLAGGTPSTATTPSASARAAQAAPRPGGLAPIFPSGLSSGSGASVSQDPIARTTAPIPPSSTPPTGTTPPATGGGTGTFPNPLTPVTPVATNVLGAGATVRGPAQDLGGAGGFSAHDQARSFFFADANKDGELTRAEAGRLSILTLPFEEMDRNFDGVITRFEYEDSLR